LQGGKRGRGKLSAHCKRKKKKGVRRKENPGYSWPDKKRRGKRKKKGEEQSEISVSSTLIY